MKKNNRGITIISLIITVIIILILLGLTDLILPDDIFDKADETEEQTSSKIKEAQNEIDNIKGSLPDI